MSIGASFSIDAQKDGSSYKAERAETNYAVKVGIDGIESGVKDGVHRNVEYNIYVTIVGDGRLIPTDPDPTETDLFVKTEVVDWGSVKQEVTGE